MNTNLMYGHRTDSKRSWKHFGASLIVLGFLGGCSSVPDAVNPVEWYHGAVDAFSDDETAEDTASQTENAATVPGEDEDFPSLASVPERPSVESGDDVTAGLIADPNKPQYATAITRQSNDDGVELPPIDVNNLQPAPPAQPVISVAAKAVDLPPVEPAMPETPVMPVVPVMPETPSASGTISNTADSATMALASTPLVVEPGRLPSGETYEQYRARLMAGLDQTGTSSATTVLLAKQQPAGQLNATGTVIISSQGIQNGGQFAGGTTTSVSHGVTSTSGFLQIDSAGGQPLLMPGSVKVATIHFSNGSAGLNGTDRRVLRQVAALLQQQGGTIRIIGHASSRTRAMDPVRHKMVNYNVSVARADHIARELVRLGAPKNQILIGAVSDSEPLYFEVMPSGEAGNRRAEIYIDS